MLQYKSSTQRSPPDNSALRRFQRFSEPVDHKGRDRRGARLRLFRRFEVSEDDLQASLAGIRPSTPVASRIASRRGSECRSLANGTTDPHRIHRPRLDRVCEQVNGAVSANGL